MAARLRADPVSDGLDGLTVKALLVVQMAVDGRFGHACLLCDLLHACLGVAAPCEHRKGAFQATTRMIFEDGP
jgi:hypothetical protein